MLGLDPSKMVPAKKSPHALISGRRRPQAPISLTEARAKLKGEVEQAFSSTGTTVLRVTPGGGKSTSTILEIIRRVESKDGQRYLYLCPTRELAEEKAEEIRAMSNVSPLLLEGRMPGNCALIGKVRAAALGGYRAGEAICPACPYQNGCGYYRQMRSSARAAVVVSVWEHLHLVESGRLNPHHIVIDEFPERALVDDDIVTVPALHSWLSKHKSLGAAADLLARVASRAEKLTEGEAHAKSWRGDKLRKLILTTNRKAAKVFRDAVLPAVDAMDVGAGILATLDTSQIAQLPPLQVCKLILSIDGEMRSASSSATCTSLVCTPTGAHYQNTSVVDLEIQSKLRLVLDGYGRRGIYERMLGCSVKVVEIDAEFLGRVWQIPVNTSRSAIDSQPDRILRLGRRVIESLRRMGHLKILVLTFQAYRERVEALGVDVRHFGQGVGVNTYRHTHTAAVVLGTPRRPHRTLVSTASALHSGRDPIDEDMAPHTNHLYVDPRLQEVLEVSREDEIAQGVHRIGPVIPGDTLKDIVVVGSVEVTELPPPIVIRPRMLELVDRIQAWVRKHGWWCNALRDLAYPACLGRDADRHKRIYNEAVKVGIGQLPYHGPQRVQVGGESFPLGFVWGDVALASDWCRNFATTIAPSVTWDQPSVSRLARSMGLSS